MALPKGMVAILTPAWHTWLASVWPTLCAGHTLPVYGLEHPSESGFIRPRMSEPVGQICNWVYPLQDGSRIHVHEFASGALYAHRDKYDPGKSPVRHLFLETKTGKTIAKVGMCAIVGRWVAT